MDGVHSSILYVTKDPADYDKALGNEQKQYNHRNNYEDFITLLKPIWYTRDIGKTSIVIHNINLMNTNAPKMKCSFLCRKKEILHWNICLPTQCQ